MRSIVMLIAWWSAVTALTLGVIAIVAMLQLPGPLQLCSLFGECITGNLTGRMYFSGDSMAAPAFHLRLVVGPMLALVGVSLVARGLGWGAALAGLSALAVGLPQAFVGYALLPLHPLVFVETLVTFGALVAHIFLRPPPMR